MATTTLARPAPPASPAPRPGPRRLVEIDVLRGLAIVGMLFVNNPGDRTTTPWPLRHAEWHGLTPADLVFPLFFVTIGLSLPFSRRADDARGALRRVGLLWLAGAVLSSVKWGRPHLGSGVLQHIAGAYLAGWLLLRLPRRWQLPACGAVLAAYCAAATWVPRPGGQPDPWAPGVNLAARVDTAVFGGPTSEGVLAMVASSTLIVAGVWLGRLLAAGASQAAVGVRAGAAGLLGLAVASAGVPVNKHLWTPSYALVTFALSAALLVVARGVLRERGVGWTARRLAELGANPIAVYVVFHLLSYTALRVLRLDAVPALRPVFGPVGAGVAYSATIALAAVGFAWLLARRRIYVRL